MRVETFVDPEQLCGTVYTANGWQELGTTEGFGRVRQPQAMRVRGMFRRFGNSLFLHWRSRQNKPQHKTTTDLLSALNAEHHRYAMICLHARRPSFPTAS